jgi:D-serine deaminase-like pyridoxal phosphate-dependent protein
LMKTETYLISNERDILSPALIYYEDIIRENTRRVIELAGGADRLWPHVKSHKTRQLIEMQREMGIDRFKCATITEAEMVAGCGAKHVLLAYPLIGPAVSPYLDLFSQYPATHFYVLVDSAEGLSEMGREAVSRSMRADALIDVNLGMNRTGVPIDKLADFCRACMATQGVRYAGLHCYDGHVHNRDIAQRTDVVSDEMRRVHEAMAGIDIPLLIGGGSPSFPCHAKKAGEYLSPGTVFVWDWGYLKNYPDLPFEPGAAILGRVVSLPADDLFTIDVGNKAVASDPAGQKGAIVGMEDAAEPVLQSEEHWAWRVKKGDRPAIGTVVYVIPTHICPTSALYESVLVAKNGRCDRAWKVAARNRPAQFVAE